MSPAAQAPEVQTRREGAVLVVSINNPPVNALGQAVRAGLLAAVEQAEGDDAYRRQSDPPSEFLHWFSARPPHHAPKRFFQFHQ